MNEIISESKPEKLAIKQIAEAFSTHQFKSTYPYFSDNIIWNMVGNKDVEGRENIIRSCEESAEYLAAVTTTFNKFNVVVDKNIVAIDSLAEYIDQEQVSSKVASCDIYSFVDGKLSQITSYCIEINQ